MIASMKRLNREAALAAIEVGARCATDVTGFGLLGHAWHIARASDVTLRIVPSVLPVLPGVTEALAAGIRTGGAERNDAFLAEAIAWGTTTDEQRALLVDPQTSGGLLVAVPVARTADYVSRVDGSVVIGEVLPPGEHRITLAG